MNYDELYDIDLSNEINEVPKCVHQAVLNANSIILQQKVSNKKTVGIAKRKTLFLVAVITVILGLTACAAINLLMRRMESMDESEINEYVKEVYSTSNPVRYTRGLSQSERERELTLRKSYEEGLFPENDIAIMSVDEYKGEGIAFDYEKNVFCLPDRELTDEELLEIIDYLQKCDYSLQVTDSNEIEVNNTDKIEKESVANDGKYMDFKFDEITYSGSLDKIQCKIAANYSGIYLSDGKIIEKQTFEGNHEIVYRTQDNERLVAYYVDQSDNMYLSMMHYDKNSDESYGRLIKANQSGECILEYDLSNAYDSLGNRLSDNYAYNMVVDEKENLYINLRNRSSKDDILFKFDVTGKCVGKVSSDIYRVHECNELLLDANGKIKVIASDVSDNDTGSNNELLTIDTEKLIIDKADKIDNSDIIYPVDLLYEKDNGVYYGIGLDGIYKITDSNSIEIITKGYEENWFSEGCKLAKIDNDRFVDVYSVDNNTYNILYGQLLVK